MSSAHPLTYGAGSLATSSGKCVHRHRAVPERFVVEADIALMHVNFTMVSRLAASSSDQ
jgi:hypothetical protein